MSLTIAQKKFNMLRQAVEIWEDDERGELVLVRHVNFQNGKDAAWTLIDLSANRHKKTSIYLGRNYAEAAEKLSGMIGRGEIAGVVDAQNTVLTATIKTDIPASGLKAGDSVEVLEQQDGKFLCRVDKPVRQRKEFKDAFGSNARTGLVTVQFFQIAISLDIDFSPLFDLMGDDLRLAEIKAYTESAVLSIDITPKKTMFAAMKSLHDMQLDSGARVTSHRLVL